MDKLHQHNYRSGAHYEYDTPSELLAAVEKAIKETEVVADIGCGILPISYFRPKLHIMVEPWAEYADILSYRYSGDKSVIVLRAGAVEALQTFSANSVDSIFLIDVIEHLEKADGEKVIAECERVAREQVVIFTPLGFMPQSVEAGETDGWGLSGTSAQEHRSGWTPNDFGPAWSFHICKEYHRSDFKDEKLAHPYGAFFAICNLDAEPVTRPAALSDIRRPLPSEIRLQAAELELASASSRCKVLEQDCARLQQQLDEQTARYEALASSPLVAYARRLKRVLSGIGLKK